MNCSPGDIAIVVRSYAGNEGKIVTCKKHRYGGFEFEKGRFLSSKYADWWEIDVSLNCIDANLKQKIINTTGLYFAPDSHLRPLRDQDGKDETLAWAGKPKKEKV